MLSLLPWVLLAFSTAWVLYHRSHVRKWLSLVVASLLFCVWVEVPETALIVALASVLIVAPILLLPALRRPLIASPLLRIYRRILPPLSETERVALAAGTVGFEGELFSGKPNWSVLLDAPAPHLSVEEQAFLSGPVEEVCGMVDDWHVSHESVDLTPQVWQFLKDNKFFGMIIPKEYGGLGFSAFAHHCVVQKLASCSVTLSSTVGVPNSLGPAELLLHYGTAEQKTHYLPRLADGREIPCFALTGPFAGSDATSIPDTGIVCKGVWEGKEVLGVRMNFDKRYITLAPVATLIGVAFRMLDPQGLLGSNKDIGISLALVPRETYGVVIGRRHFPLNAAFQNGPIQGHDVFVPLDQLIGGQAYAGQGWRMLVECLSIGRSITLPSFSSGGSRLAAVATGAYARIRKQFGLSVGRFEGVEEALARIGARAYAITALAQATSAAVDRGEKPAVPSAIAKYHCTTMGRQVIQDAMDVHGGKGIILGPRNYLGRGWQYTPIGITVEGANIMTRSLMIFGQGAILCHPWVMKEMRAAQNEDRKQGLIDFDRAFARHVRDGLSNAVRAFWFGLTASRLGKVPGDDYTRRFYRKLNRYSAALSLMSDASMLLLGSRLKFKETLSGRLGDVLSQLYIASSMLRHHQDERSPGTDHPLLAWAFHDSIHQIEQALSAALRNFPNRPVSWLLWCLIFPWGRRAVAPSDRLGHKVASLLMSSNDVTARLAEGVYTTPGPYNPAGRLIASLPEAIAAEPIERKFQKLLRAQNVEALSFAQQLDEGIHEGWITQAERVQLERLRELTLDAITVDDFDPAQLRAGSPHPPRLF
jgi:acyl-CoA dehydrogenase